MYGRVSVLFSEPKIPQYPELLYDYGRFRSCFSALQRAENSSIIGWVNSLIDVWKFQCSSASRKFLNRRGRRGRRSRRGRVSVLFSEPKIPQSLSLAWFRCSYRVSVLFSEPKIPQSWTGSKISGARSCFSALQRAENSSISAPRVAVHATARFQCSSASRKFLNADPHLPRLPVLEFQCSSASRKFLNPG